MRKFLFILFLLNSVAATAQENGPTVGTKLRSLSGKDLLTGKLIDIQFKESPGYTLLHFWHTESDSCTKDFAEIVSMEKRYHQKISVYGFPYEDRQHIPRTKEYIVRYKLNWSQLFQYKQNGLQGANVIDVMKVDEFPTYILLNKEGTILVRSTSLMDVQAVLKSELQY